MATRQVAHFEPVPPRLARNTIIESTFEVGRRFRCTMRVDRGQLDPGARIRPARGEWHPRMPERLDEGERIIEIGNDRRGTVRISVARGSRMAFIIAAWNRPAESDTEVGITAEEGAGTRRMVVPSGRFYIW
jgi:hypothetical protein